MATIPRSAPPAPLRAPVRNVGAGVSLPLTFDVRTAYDFALSLASEVGEHDELPAGRPPLAERARASALDRGAGRRRRALHLRRRPAHRPAGHHRRRGLRRHCSAPDDRRRVRAASCSPTSSTTREHRTTSQRALDGDRDAAERIIGTWPEHKQGWLRPLFDDPTALISSDRRPAWPPGCRSTSRSSRACSRSSSATSSRAPTTAHVLPLGELIERTTNGIRWLSEPGVRRLVLAPSYLGRPYNFTFNGRTGGSSSTRWPTRPSSRTTRSLRRSGVLRLHRALGDDTRLRILRLLRDRDWYLTEIAERLELSKPTIKHHLAQLRAAGLVTLIEEGGLSYFSLRRERLDDVSSELKLYLA